jgi:hypothetical protein
MNKKLTVHADIENLIENSFLMIEMNNLVATVNGASTESIAWSNLSDNFKLSEENLLISCRLILRLILTADVADLQNDLLKRVLDFFRGEHFLSLISFGMVDSSGRSDLSQLAYGLYSEINKLGEKKPEFKYSFPFKL